MIVLTAVFSAKAASKACSSCGFKATEQWLAQQVHVLPDCDCSTLLSPCPISFGLFLTITGRYLIPCFAPLPEQCWGGEGKGEANWFRPLHVWSATQSTSVFSCFHRPPRGGCLKMGKKGRGKGGSLKKQGAKNLARGCHPTTASQL
nr:hypothetical protein [Arsenophonus sp.]